MSDSAATTIFVVIAVPICVFVWWIARNATKELRYGSGWHEREKQRKREASPEDSSGLSASRELPGVVNASSHRCGSPDPVAVAGGTGGVGGAYSATSVTSDEGNMIVVVEGRGSHYSRLFSLHGGLTYADCTYEGQHTCFVHLLDERGDLVERLASMSGPGSQGKAFSLGGDGQYLVNVDSSGPWKVTLRQLPMIE